MKFWPFRHMALKVWSLVLATMLWFVIAGEETVERGLRVPLELQQFPAGLEMQTEPPALVDVRVRGASGTLSRMGAGDIVAVLDLRSARAGRRLFQLTPEQVRVPFGVQVMQVTPTSLALTFENSASRQVPIEPAVEGTPAPGYVVGTVTVEPSRVEVVGPQSAVDRVTEALTEPVSVAGATQAVTDSVTVGFAEPTLRLRSPRTAIVTIQVMPGPVERELSNRPIRVRNLSDTLTAAVTPSSATLVLRGSRQGIDRVDIGEVQAYVDLAGVGPGDYSVPVHAESPQEAGVARIIPASVQVHIVRGKN
jgi:hypothetical protein